MKVTVLRTDPAGTPYFDADSQCQVLETTRQPVRLLAALDDPKPVSEDDLKHVRTVLALTNHQSKVKFLGPLIESVSDELTEAMLSRGDANILDHCTVMLEAKREEAWAVKDRKRQASLRFWAFRNKVVKVEGWESASREEIVTSVVHKVLSEEKAFDRMRAEIERFRLMDRASGASREPIPEEVRIFVHRRDQGKCVRCGSQENIEFDHIIPVAKGGSSTARNVQILCERCNREKGQSI